MNKARLDDLELAASQATDTLNNLRQALEVARREAGDRPRARADLEVACERIFEARVAVHVARNILAGLRCDTSPCDRANGLCPKCDGRPPVPA